MFGKKKKDKKKAAEMISSLTANGVAIKVINFALTHTPENEPVLQVRTPDVCEALHYDEIDFELRTTVKLLKIKAKFKDAKSEKHFKLYLFSILDYEQFFI